MTDTCFECGFRRAVEDGMCLVCLRVEARLAAQPADTAIATIAAADAVREVVADRDRARPAEGVVFVKAFGFKLPPGGGPR
ncbi:hypothetical protein [Mycolicibacterium fortuitum]|uniref:hypothetical protein n=1 Tax=Mycolicibacterium fortuitum TaxID=1766 RepID=UPI00148FAE89|nr:hypothetical protein [Mycolicibacterium fortuitum]NOR01359.1 hypothetical protein [Mycolicibacterium fortuitum]